MAGPKHYDSFSALPLGVNSGVETLLLPREQASWATNATFRGGFISHRSRVQKQTLNFNGDAALQAAVEEGYFQGAWWYRPDFGLTQIVASISGRLFAFVKPGDSWTVTEITIAGDAGDPTIPRVWMWQSEKWLIISDGSGKLPIFYDGVSCRRSYGPSVDLVPVGQITGTAPLTPPDIGGSVTLTLSLPYTGTFDVPVIFNGAFYQVVGSLTGNVILTNVTGIPAVVEPIGTDVIVNPNLVGYTTAVAVPISVTHTGTSCVIPIYCNSSWDVRFDVSLTSLGSLAIGSTVLVQTSMGPRVGVIDNITGLLVRLRIGFLASQSPCASCAPVPLGAVTIPNNSLVQFSTPMGPNVILGQLTAAYTNPAVGGALAASMSVPYSGPANQLVTIGAGTYVINSVPAVGGLSLILINLTDTSTTAYDAPPGRLATLGVESVPELPAGRMGAYISQRNVMSLTDGLGFIVGDIVGGAAGTVANSYRDAVLKTTENDYQAGGGTFRIPSAGEIINSISETAVLDTSFGQGPGQIGTDSSIFSINLPTDRSTWQSLTNPVLPKSLKGFGPLAQNSTVLANSDILFRQIEGLGSLIIARRNFNEGWGNTPISREMGRILDQDEKTLLAFGSAVVFDNRFLITTAPTAGPQGVYHAGLVALNFDLISNLRGKAPPIYDGLWTGLNTLQLVTGNFSGTGRAYAFGYNLLDEQIELYEIVPTTIGGNDNGTIPIQWNVESPPIFRPEQRNKEDLLVRLLQGQIHLRDVVGLVQITVKYRPDFWPCWIEWASFEVCADTTVTDGKPGYRTPVGLGEPSAEGCESANNRPYRVGRFFQIRVEVTGSCKIMGMEFEAMTEPVTPFVPPLCCPVTSETIPLPT